MSEYRYFLRLEDETLIAVRKESECVDQMEESPFYQELTFDQSKMYGNRPTVRKIKILEDPEILKNMSSDELIEAEPAYFSYYWYEGVKASYDEKKGKIIFDLSHVHWKIYLKFFEISFFNKIGPERLLHILKTLDRDKQLGLNFPPKEELEEYINDLEYFYCNKIFSNKPFYFKILRAFLLYINEK